MLGLTFFRLTLGYNPGQERVVGPGFGFRTCSMLQLDSPLTLCNEVLLASSDYCLVLASSSDLLLPLGYGSVDGPSFDPVKLN